MAPDQLPENLYGTADQLPSQLWDDLAARPPDEAARATGAELKDGRIFLPLLGREYALDPKVRRIREKDRPEAVVDFQTGMVLVSTLGRAMDAPPAGRMVTPQQLPGGSFFFTGPHAIPTGRLCKHFGGDPALLLERAAEMGGRPIEGADAAVVLQGLPRLPVYVFLWAADDEFKASATVGMDAHAHLHLALDGLWALSNILVSRLIREK